MGSMDDLQAAFAGESQANRKYLAFAQKADAEGLPQVARLFRAAAEAETVHAHAHLRAMGGINNTTENLRVAIAGEGYEFKEMYPEFLETARKEGNKSAEFTFKYALAVEGIHHDLYARALEAVEGGGDLPEAVIYVCSVCGNTVENHVPDTCPICNVAKDKFFEVT